MFRVLTVAREYGSGGGGIARKTAEELGWSLLDKGLVERIARAAQVDPELAQRYDERIDSLAAPCQPEWPLVRGDRGSRDSQ